MPKPYSGIVSSANNAPPPPPPRFVPGGDLSGSAEVQSVLRLRGMTILTPGGEVDPNTVLTAVSETEADWLPPSGGGGGGGDGVLTFDKGHNIRATWPDYSPVGSDEPYEGIVNISIAGGESTGAAANYATILGGLGHRVRAICAAIVGGRNNRIYEGENSIVLAGNSNETGGENAIAGGYSSFAASPNSIAIGLNAAAFGNAAAAFGGNHYSGTVAGGHNSFAHGAGGYAQTHSEYVHAACDESEGLIWQYGRCLVRGRVDGDTETKLTTANYEFEEELAVPFANERTCYIFKVNIMATRKFSDAAPGSAVWVRTVAAHIDEGQELVIDDVHEDVTVLNGESWSIDIVADNSGYPILRVTVTGSAGQVLRVTGWIEYGYCSAFPNF